VHSHVIPLAMLQAIEANPARYRMRFDEHNGKRRIVRDGGHTFPVYDEFYDPEVKVAAWTGGDSTCRSSRPRRWCSSTGWTPTLRSRLARLINDGIVKMAAAQPERLRPMGTLPMQNPDAAWLSSSAS
jgi:aminocarboxymuconate-semialdehyde decarboxylase